MVGDAEIELRLTTSDTRRQAVEIRDVESARLRPLLGAHELILVGGRSVVGALSRGDVDLHLRVAPGDFAVAVQILGATYRVVHREIWQPTLATFEVGGAVETGVAVTPTGSSHDLRFSRAWARLAREPELLERYNTIKLGSRSGDYEDRKGRFFDELEAMAQGAAPGRRTGPRSAPV
jgi:hypothetical protein